MGIDYENINRCEEYQCDSFLPFFFFSNLKKESENNSRILMKKEEVESLKNTPTKSVDISKSRKSTIDEEYDIIFRNKNTFTSKKDDKLKDIFMNKNNSPFFSSSTEINILNNENDEFYLNFKEEKDIRKSYYSKLIYKNIWSPGLKTKSYNSLFIFDWDDTLFPTTSLIKEELANIDVNNMPDEIGLLISTLEEAVINIINLALNKGNVYIITNSSLNWFNYSSNNYFPNLKNIIDKIKVISARDEYGYMNPTDNKIWKKKAFLDLTKDINTNLITNIICYGDSMIELEAAKILASQFNDSCLKTIKFKENPEIEDLIRQLSLIEDKFNFIFSNPKSLSIKIEQKI